MKGGIGYIIKMIQFYQSKLDKLRGLIEKSNWICASLELEKNEDDVWELIVFLT